MRTVKLNHVPKDRGESPKIIELPPPRFETHPTHQVLPISNLPIITSQGLWHGRWPDCAATGTRPSNPPQVICPLVTLPSWKNGRKMNGKDRLSFPGGKVCFPRAFFEVSGAFSNNYACAEFVEAFHPLRGWNGPTWAQSYHATPVIASGGSPTDKQT